MKKIIFVLAFLLGCSGLSETSDSVKKQNEVLCNTCKASSCETELKICYHSDSCFRFDACVNQTDKTCNECVKDPDISAAKNNWSNLNDCLCDKCGDFCTESCSNVCVQ